MSEHPELREALMAIVSERQADALLAPAGPVGKLQAELAEVRARLAEADKALALLDPGCFLHLWPGRSWHDAEGSMVMWADEDQHRLFIEVVDPTGAALGRIECALAAGESAVTGEAT